MKTEKILLDLDEAEREYAAIVARCESNARTAPAMKKEIELRVKREMQLLGEDPDTLKAEKLKSFRKMDALRSEARKLNLTPLSQRKSEPIAVDSESNSSETPEPDVTTVEDPQPTEPPPIEPSFDGEGSPHHPSTSQSPPSVFEDARTDKTDKRKGDKRRR